MKTLLERAARALCSLDGNPENATLGGMPLWRDYLPEARVVLGALREPSKAMTELGDALITSAPRFGYGSAKVWQVMLDAALDEGPA